MHKHNYGLYIHLHFTWPLDHDQIDQVRRPSPKKVSGAGSRNITCHLHAFLAANTIISLLETESRPNQPQPQDPFFIVNQNLQELPKKVLSLAVAIQLS